MPALRPKKQRALVWFFRTNRSNQLLVQDEATEASATRERRPSQPYKFGYFMFTKSRRDGLASKQLSADNLSAMHLKEQLLTYINEAQLGNCTEAIIEQLIARIAPQTQAQHRDGEAYVMVFDGAKATACLRGTDLLLRVEAYELLACEGVQSLLLATLARLVPQMPVGILWVPA